MFEIFVYGFLLFLFFEYCKSNCTQYEFEDTLPHSKELNRTFYDLTPNEVLDTIQDVGFYPQGEYFQLNSYENRVFDIFGADNSNESLWTSNCHKVLSPNRWSEQSLLEEHEFLNDLQQAQIPAIAPMVLKNNSTLYNADGIWMCVSKRNGAPPQEFNQ
ncbi:MAG: hypothetical protein R2827_00520 [Bdellovibrionales bacterium]